jgi:hypothetical protein
MESWQRFFSYSVGSLFNLVTISFVVQKIFNFIWSYLSIISLSYWAIWILFRKSLSMPINFSVFPILFCTSFKVSGLTLKSLIQFELIFVQGEWYGSSFSFLQAYNKFSQQHLLKRLSFLYHIFLAPLSKIMWAWLHGLISGSSLLFHLSSCPFLCHYYVGFCFCFFFFSYGSVV